MAKLPDGHDYMISAIRFVKSGGACNGCGECPLNGQHGTAGAQTTLGSLRILKLYLVGKEGYFVREN